MSSRPRDLRLDAGLLANFAQGRVPRRLARLDMAAGQAPKAAAARPLPRSTSRTSAPRKMAALAPQRGQGAGVGHIGIAARA